MTEFPRYSRWYDPLIYTLLMPPFAGFLKSLMWSCRLTQVTGREACRAALAKTDGRAVYITWHQRLLGHWSEFKDLTNLYIMISRSRDGSLVTALARRFQIDAVRGSSSKGGARALKAAIEVVDQGGAIGMLADGPRGPARISKFGSFQIAQSANVPIIPVSWSADRCWMFNSWDRHIIPKPFARISVAYGKPMWVDAHLDRPGIKALRNQLNDNLNDITARCDRVFGPERPWRRVKKAGTPETGPLL